MTGVLTPPSVPGADEPQATERTTVVTPTPPEVQEQHIAGGVVDWRPPVPPPRGADGRRGRVRLAVPGLVIVVAAGAVALDVVTLLRSSPSPPFRVLSWTALGLCAILLAAVAVYTARVAPRLSHGAPTSRVAPIVALIAVVVASGTSGYVAMRGPSCLQRTGAGADLRTCDFGGQDLRGRDLTKANLAGVSLAKADLGAATLAGANLGNAKLAGADLSKTNLGSVDGTNADFSGANLAAANLAGATLTGSTLSGANLSDAILSDAKLGRAGLQQTDLSRANLDRAVLDLANLQGAVLDHTSLVGVLLAGVDLTGAKLTAVTFTGASLLGAVGLTDPSLATALGVAQNQVGRTLVERSLPLEDATTIETTLRAACGGTAVAGAGTSGPGGSFHPMILNGMQPPSDQIWAPPALRFAEYVGCVELETTRVVQSCPYVYASGGAAPPIDRQQNIRHVRVINPATGAVVLDKVLEGTMPSGCPQQAPVDQHVVNDGSHVADTDVLAVLAPLVGEAPKAQGATA